ncbi:MAG: carboxylesterase [Burkholderiales bacterium]|nr:carboxylesterase [Burkholderiales bacterium]MDE1926798.1 carboxylesterase [Burkholderiales bacterium]MDE2159067.1 carboxylesterase [Burkholderiales bacterium]MDE2504081.1 carboxylesterase [Burkholderiales bacterium]
MTLQSIELDPGTAPAATVIILHGLGADGTDFLPVADEIDLRGIGPVRWVFPRAPVRPVTINGGQPMRAWYDILGTDLVRREDEAGLRDAYAQVHGLLEREVARGVAARRIVLAGFSQGCAITLGAGLRYGQRLAGLAGMSGYMPLAATFEAERAAANRATPVFLAHGRNDGVVPLARGVAARDLMLAQGQAVEWHEYPMEHSVCIEEIRALQAWLLRVLG